MYFHVIARLPKFAVVDPSLWLCCFYLGIMKSFKCIDRQLKLCTVSRYRRYKLPVVEYCGTTHLDKLRH
jgi:hypothetical protein